MQYGRRKPITEQTLETIEKRSKLFLRVFAGCEIEEIDKEKIMYLKKVMYDRNNKDGYISGVLTYLKSILRWCLEEANLSVMDYKDIKPPKRQRVPAKYFSIPQIATILNSMPHTVQGIRNKALIASMLSGGARITENLSLNKDTITRDSTGGGKAEIIGKGRKEGILFFHPWAMEAIEAYLVIRKDDNPALFVNHKKDGTVERMTASNVRRYFLRLSKKVNIHIHSHKIRKTYATHFQHSGGNMGDLQNLLRHSLITTTQIYVEVDYDRLQKVHHEVLSYGQEVTKIITTPLVFQWASKYEHCLMCGTTEKQHAAHGYCYMCLMRSRKEARLCITA